MKNASSQISSKRRWLFRALAAGIPTLAGVGLFLLVMQQLELLVVDPETQRWRLQSRPIYLQEPGQELTGHRYLYDAQLGWRNIPQWQATTMGYKLTINRLGLRGPEYPYEKPPNVRRLLLLGDSYAWGYGVGDEEHLARRLEDRLDNWQVINTGVSGWGTDQQLLFLKHEGVRYSPDVVVVAFFLFNDPTNVARSVQYGLSKPVFMDTNLTLHNVPVPKPGASQVDMRSQAAPIPLAAAILQDISRVCQQRQCPLVVMKFGAFLGLESEKMQRWEADLENRLEQHPEINYLDLDDAFKQRRLTRQALLEGNNDGHWNAFGHEQTARILYEYLYDQQLLD